MTCRGYLITAEDLRFGSVRSPASNRFPDSLDEGLEQIL
jgi:hypothetical protein